jgi:hypothetical protein
MTVADLNGSAIPLLSPQESPFASPWLEPIVEFYGHMHLRLFTFLPSA